MTDFPAIDAPQESSVTGTPQLLHELIHIALTVSATGAWPTANLAVFVPMPVSRMFTARKLFVVNGGTVSGNIDVGVYSSTFALLVSSGSTAQAGTTAVQPFDITDTVLSPGLYYLAVAMDNTTGIINNWAPSLSNARMMSVVAATSSFPLPAQATISALASAFIPGIHVTEQTVI